LLTLKPLPLGFAGPAGGVSRGTSVAPNTSVLGEPAVSGCAAEVSAGADATSSVPRALVLQPAVPSARRMARVRVRSFGEVVSLPLSPRADPDEFLRRSGPSRTNRSG
jgi:hypothetical protein